MQVIGRAFGTVGGVRECRILIARGRTICLPALSVMGGR